MAWILRARNRLKPEFARKGYSSLGSQTGESADVSDVSLQFETFLPSLIKRRRFLYGKLEDYEYKRGFQCLSKLDYIQWRLGASRNLQKDIDAHIRANKLFVFEETRGSLVLHPVLTVIWEKPIEGYKLNFDGAYKQGLGGYSYVIRTKTGAIADWLCSKIPYVESPYESELAGCYFGLKRCQELGYENVIVEGDCLKVILELQGWIVPDPKYARTYSEIFAILRSFKHYRVKHIYREGNVVADALASLTCDKKEVSYRVEHIYREGNVVADALASLTCDKKEVSLAPLPTKTHTYIKEDCEGVARFRIAQHPVSCPYFGENSESAAAFDLTPDQEECLQRLQIRVDVAYDSSIPEHQEALWALWDAAFPQEPLLVSGQWGSMGWLREDPSTDLRGGGFVSLENLLYLAGNFPKSFQDLLNKQDGVRARWEYPFAAVGVNITLMLIQMLDLKAVKPRTMLGATFLKFLAENESAFDLLYCIAFKLMDHECLTLQASSYKDLNAVMIATRRQLETELLHAGVTRLEDLPSYSLLK